MAILSKILGKSLSNFRYACRNSCSINPSLYIPKRHLELGNLKNDDDNNINFLLKRCQGNTFNDMHYFSALSTEKGQNFSPKYNLYLPFYSPHVVGSCNGLLCLNDAENKLVLWNPSTNEFKFLPQSSVQRPPSAVNIPYCSGFGFDPKSEDYKVVNFVSNNFEDDPDLDTQQQVELYSLKSDSWKEISDPDAYVFYYPSTYVNGFYYWLAYGETEKFILSFDFANEKFSSLPLPIIGKPLEGPYILDLLKFDESLGLIVYPWRGTEKSFDLWVMNGSWTRKSFINVSGWVMSGSSWTRESVIHVSGAKMPLGFGKNSELFLEGSNNELLLFDRATGELKNLDIYDYPETMQLIPYVENSFPLNGKSELEERVMHQPDMENKEVDLEVVSML